MAWGIADTAPQIEKIRAESSDYLGGLNSVGEIDYSLYCRLWDFYHDLLGKAYEQGLKDAPNDKRKDVEMIKHGRWIENYTTYSDVTRQTCTCSVCGRHSLRPLGDFCRWCGAKMDEDEWQEPEINPCRGCDDYDGQGGCKSNGGCGTR